MSGACDGKIVVVTGAARGIGRGHALEFARQGARVVVNDLGGARDGSGSTLTPAEEVVGEIEAMGGEAIANGDDVSEFSGAEKLIGAAISQWGRLDVLVNNAGILRDRMLTNMTESEWDSVIKVHLRGTFAPAHFAAAHWRERIKAGETVSARIINTTSVSGIFGNAGQTNYGAAKAGIAMFTVIAAMELGRYGVTVNAVAPTALTRLTEDLGMGARAAEREADEFDVTAPENIAPVVVWLATDAASEVTGRVFIVSGGRVAVAEGWRRGPTADKGDRWEVSELDDVLPDLVANAAPNSTLFS